MEDGIEKKILQEMSNRLVANKSELIEIFKGKNIQPSIIESTIKSLVQRGLLVPVYSSSPTFAITQKGLKQSNV
ncbi:MAG: hypothetical protein QXY45_02255 [Candidatus Aenigmatarchaeota archaeon]